MAAFLADLDPARRAVVEVLRETILEGRPQLTERIKWNSPSYVVGGVDVATINVKNKQGRVQLVLHLGTKRAENRSGPPILTDDEGLVSWQSDIRGLVAFDDRESAERNRAALDRVITRWLRLAEPPG